MENTEFIREPQCFFAYYQWLCHNKRKNREHNRFFPLLSSPGGAFPLPPGLYRALRSAYPCSDSVCFSTRRLFPQAQGIKDTAVTVLSAAAQAEAEFPPLPSPRFWKPKRNPQQGSSACFPDHPDRTERNKRSFCSA